MNSPHTITDSADIWTYITGGRGSFTLVSKKTGARFTFKTYWSNNRQALFCLLLTSPDLYRYIGLIDWDRRGLLVLTRMSYITDQSDSYRALQWLLRRISKGADALPDSVEFWHDGRCCKCGRQLTAPESIAAGIGPVCAGK